jgi:hypothetical protein
MYELSSTRIAPDGRRTTGRPGERSDFPSPPEGAFPALVVIVAAVFVVTVLQQISPFEQLYSCSLGTAQIHLAVRIVGACIASIVQKSR